MNKIKCKHDKEAEVLVNEKGDCFCCNLKANNFRKTFWKCEITDRRCGYNTYDEEGGAFFDIY